MIFRKIIEIEIEREEMMDITETLRKVLRESRIKKGLLHVFGIGSTVGITTIEYEPGLKHDFFQAMERIAPSDAYYKHHERWHDDNGKSHVRASIIKQDLTIPIEDGRLLLGTWQQVIVINFDTTPRRRKIVITIIGE